MTQKHRVFIDGEAGTTGLQIRARLEARRDLDLVSIDPARRKDPAARAELLNSADLVILCLPDEAARQAVALIETLPEWAAVAFAVCYSTSIRKKEATFIRRSETNLPMINLRASETKQGKARTHGVPDTVLPLVNLWEAKTKRDYPKAEFLLHRDGAQLTVKELTDAFEKACESLGWHVPVLDDKGLPIVYMGEKVKMDRSKIRWHDSRRSAITEVSSLLTLSSQEVQKGMGISHETQAKYSQNQNAPTLILAALNAKNAKAIDVVPAAPVAVHAGTDKRSKLTELKALFDDGLIDGDEYKESKKALLAA